MIGKMFSIPVYFPAGQENGSCRCNSEAGFGMDIRGDN